VSLEPEEVRVLGIKRVLHSSVKHLHEIFSAPTNIWRVTPGICAEMHVKRVVDVGCGPELKHTDRV
jgi:hypothetical protein